MTLYSSTNIWIVGALSLPQFTLNYQVKIGELLTSLTILISLITLTVGWNKDRNLRRKEQADKLRTAAAKALAKLDRWLEIARWYYRDVEPIFVEASVMLAKDFDQREKRQERIYEVRDYLWKSLTQAHIDSSRRVLDEEIEIAYVDLYGYDRRVRDSFVSTIALWRDVEEVAFTRFLFSTQDALLSYLKLRGKYQSAKLGNSLRELAADSYCGIDAECSTISHPIRHFLMELLGESDSEILSRKRLPLIPSTPEHKEESQSLTNAGRQPPPEHLGESIDAVPTEVQETGDHLFSTCVRCGRSLPTGSNRGLMCAFCQGTQSAST